MDCQINFLLQSKDCMVNPLPRGKTVVLRRPLGIVIKSICSQIEAFCSCSASSYSSLLKNPTDSTRTYSQVSVYSIANYNPAPISLSQGPILTNIPACMQLQCSSKVRQQLFSYLEKASMTALVHQRMLHTSHWQGYTFAGNLDRFWPLAPLYSPRLTSEYPFTEPNCKSLQ